MVAGKGVPLQKLDGCGVSGLGLCAGRVLAATALGRPTLRSCVFIVGDVEGRKFPPFAAAHSVGWRVHSQVGDDEDLFRCGGVFVGKEDGHARDGL